MTMVTNNTDAIITALENSGIDVECGACMEVAFTGVTTNVHTCASVAQRVDEAITSCLGDESGRWNQAVRYVRRVVMEALSGHRPLKKTRTRDKDLDALKPEGGITNER